MNNWVFYIVDNSYGTNKQGIQSDIGIIQIPDTFPIIQNGDGPYHSIKELRNNSEIFKKLSKSNPKLTQKILKPSNIFKVSKFLLTPKGQTFDLNELNSFIHCVTGRIKNGNLTGVHFYDKEKIEIIETLQKNEETGVSKCTFKFYDYKNNRWITKSNPSTFFPVDWNIHQLFQEILFGVRNKVKDNLSDNKYNSKTLSGVPIEIIYNNGKIKTLYPKI